MEPVKYGAEVRVERPDLQAHRSETRRGYVRDSDRTRFGETVNVLKQRVELNLDRATGKLVFIAASPAREGENPKPEGVGGAKGVLSGARGAIFDRVG